MTNHGKEMLGMESLPFAITQDAMQKSTEDLRMSVEAMFMVENMDAVCFSVPDTCFLAEARMPRNYVLNVCGMTINLTSQNQTQKNGSVTRNY